MPAEIDDLVRRLIGNDDTAPAAILERASSSTAPVLLLDALVRDHLADHPDNVLAAWIAAQHNSAG